MWKQLRRLFPFSKPSQLTISSHGQKACPLPFEQIREAMEWLGLSLMAAGYQAKAHIIWDSPETSEDLGSLFKSSLRRDEPTFLYRCGDSLSETLCERPMPPPTGYYFGVGIKPRTSVCSCL